MSIYWRIQCLIILLNGLMEVLEKWCIFMTIRAVVVKIIKINYHRTRQRITLVLVVQPYVKRTDS